MRWYRAWLKRRADQRRAVLIAAMADFAVRYHMLSEAEVTLAQRRIAIAAARYELVTTEPNLLRVSDL